MRYDTVVCLDDLLRLKFWPAKEFMYDLIRLPAWYAAGVDIACSPRNGQRSNLLPGFDHSQFLALCGGAEPDWAALYHAVPEAAADYRRLILHWRRAGMWSTQWTMLRSIAGLLARLDRHRDAALLEGAIRATLAAYSGVSA